MVRVVTSGIKQQLVTSYDPLQVYDGYVTKIVGGVVYIWNGSSFVVATVVNGVVTNPMVPSGWQPDENLLPGESLGGVL